MSTAKKLLWSNVVALVGALILWPVAAVLGWLSSVAFVAHVSMAALVFSAWSGLSSGEAAVEAEKE